MTGGVWRTERELQGRRFTVTIPFPPPLWKDETEGLREPLQGRSRVVRNPSPAATRLAAHVKHSESECVVRQQVPSTVPPQATADAPPPPTKHTCPAPEPLSWLVSAGTSLTLALTPANCSPASQPTTAFAGPKPFQQPYRTGPALRPSISPATAPTLPGPPLTPPDAHARLVSPEQTPVHTETLCVPH